MSDVAYHGLCKTCADQGREAQWCDWVSCPTGGWWSHHIHPEDSHGANVDWQPHQEMDSHGHLYTQTEDIADHPPLRWLAGDFYIRDPKRSPNYFPRNAKKPPP